MKLLIAGSRSLNNEPKIRKLLHELITFMNRPVTEIVSGCAVGVDKIGESYASMMNIPVKQMPADWTKHGKSAGMIRNKNMAEYCDWAIILWDGKSPGSKNMATEMNKVNKFYVMEIVDGL